MSFEKIKSNRGITLIALVITIIVLLILAGVTIAALSGDNGILQNGTKAKEKTDEATDIEKIKLLATDGMLVKRPIFVSDNFILLGFKEAEWQEKLSKNC